MTLRHQAARRAVGVAALLLGSASQAHAATQADVTCDGQPATIVGTDGTDTLVGTDGPDVIAGLDGNDYIYAGGGDDILCGGPGSYTGLYGEQGNDRLFTEGYGRVDGGRGDDLIDMSQTQSGRVELVFRGAPQGVRVDLVAGTARGRGDDTLLGNPSVIGTRFDDTILGAAGRNVIYGDDGDDVLDGGPGPDELVGEAGTDTLRGGSGNDEIRGGPHSDLYRGGPGDDTLDEYSFQLEDDEMYGGRGFDALRAGGGEDYGDGGPDDDLCVEVEVMVSCES